ncbi:HAD-IC family P-type ATPase [Candidatus Uhrbacteria bacterium]|jgi:P-type Ca2+ transporter type 2C|nr:HAD-IC family P-type ATPase [Candidatus Uhrbacteria bacterium]
MPTSWHALTIEEAQKKLSVAAGGLSAKRVAKLTKKHGLNRLPTKKSDPWWRLLLSQFLSPLIAILIVAAIISGILHEWVDFGVITVAVVLNTIIGFAQEFKANKALEHLKSLVQPRAMVVRGGKEIEIGAEELVPGDILLLHTGDRIGADARIIESVDLQVNESALTGESMPIDKMTEVLGKGVTMAERLNMVYAGTSVVAGRGRAIVVATGLKSELGVIARLVEETDETDTPLQKQLSQLARWIAVGVVVIVALIYLIGVFRGQSLVHMFEISVALAVAAIPEGLMVSVTIILAIGMQRILKRKALVRRLVGAETLGSVSIICTDKTGTITEGEMSVVDVVTLSDRTSLKEVTKKDDVAWKILTISALCNDASAVREKGKLVTKGSPTERALLLAAIDRGFDLEKLIKTHERTDEIPFSSTSKFMVTQNKWGASQAQFAKGAPAKILAFCSHYEQSGKRTKLTDISRKKIEDQVDGLTSEGLRLIAFGTKEKVKGLLDDEHLEGFTFLGFVGLRDPLRANARQQITAAKRAGVRTVIITGDHPQTARAIGTEAGLVTGPESVVTGAELDTWTDDELQKRAGRVSIYARVEPRHKIRIVRAWQARGDVVAMAGDGVNDAPAIKAADIGIAVGSGTEVAKQASDLVILNNDLGTITSAIAEGRVIFDNIRKVTVYLMADSFTEIILIGGSIMMGLPIPLLPAQILWINLVADTFPNIGLTLEPPEKDVMKIPPRPRDEPVLNREMLMLIFIIGIITDLVLFVLYIWLIGEIDSIETIRSIMFAAVGIDSLIYIFAVKSFRRSIFRINPFSNLYLVGGVLIGFSLMLLALIHPFFQSIFQISPLRLSDWGLLLIIAVIKLVAIEAAKEIFIIRKSKARL